MVEQRWVRFRAIAALLFTFVLSVWLLFAFVTVGWAVRRDIITQETARRLSLVPMEDLIPACHDKVKDQLRFPETAVFGGESTTGQDPYVVTGWLDSRDGLGATVRHRYRCTAWRTPFEWRADYPVFHDW